MKFIKKYLHKRKIIRNTIRNKPTQASTTLTYYHLTDRLKATKYKDYRDEREKVLTLPLEGFIRRFFLHVIPSGFIKIRHYGILSNQLKNECVEAILHIFRKKRNLKIYFDIVIYMKETLGEYIAYCPICKTSTAKILEPLPATRGDPNHFMK